MLQSCLKLLWAASS